jgi:hypothetical protein
MNARDEESIFNQNILGQIIVLGSHHLDRHRVKVMVAGLILNAFVLWHFGAALAAAKAYQASNCNAMIVHQQTVLNFWASTAVYRQRHADHELDAARRWAAISQDLKRDHIGERWLLRETMGESLMWGHLHDDDTANADLARRYVAHLQAENLTSCLAPGELPPAPHIDLP